MHRRIVQLGEQGYVVAIAGELDAAAAPGLQEAIDALPTRPLVLDLLDVTFIDSAGLALLVHAARQHRVQVVAIDPHALRLFASTGAERAFAVHPTLLQAVAAI